MAYVSGVCVLDRDFIPLALAPLPCVHPSTAHLATNCNYHHGVKCLCHSLHATSQLQINSIKKNSPVKQENKKNVEAKTEPIKHGNI